MRAFAVALLSVCALAGPAQAQDLFEVEVFPAETAAAGDTEVEFHANGLPGRGVPLGVDAIDHPVHASIEISHGLSERFEIGVFIQTAPIARGHQSPFAGGHVRPKFRFPMPDGSPMGVSLIVEYGINRTVFDENRQTLEIVPIVEHRSGRLTMVANPEWSMSFRGPDAAMAPKLSLAAKIGWQTTPTLAVAAEYYWKSEALKHFNPSAERHHSLMPALDITLSPDWALNLGVGHCLTDLNERWVLKSILGYSFR